MSLLAASDLTKSFGGVTALRGVSFTVDRGEIVALIGPNGAGKSTCFDVVNGRLRPDRGSVRLDGVEIAGLAPHRIARMGVGRTFQIAAAFGSMSVRENVQTALSAHHGEGFGFIGLANARRREEADALLAAVGMAGQAERTAAELAYGDVKRLELAIALSNAPKLLLMDEPTAGMGAGERASLMALVVRLTRERGFGVLFTEHDVDAAFGAADRVLALDRGALIAEGRPDDVRRDPAVRAIYLGARG